MMRAFFVAAAALVGLAGLGSAQFDSGTVLASTADFSSLTGVRSLATADFNNDGAPDLCYASWGGLTAFYQLNNASDPGTFLPPVALPGTLGAGGATYVAAVDVTGDGRPDVVASSFNDDGMFYWENRLHLPSADFGPQTDMGVFVDQVRTIVPGDIDGDGTFEIVYGTALQDANGDGWGYIRNNGGGSFTKVPIDGFLDGAYTVGTADVDGDGSDDVLVGTSNAGAKFYRANGSGGFEAAVVVALTADAPNVQGVAFGDVDGDGELDAVVSSRNNMGVGYYPNLGAGLGWYSPATRVNVSSDLLDVPVSVAVADFNGDNDNDVAAVAFRNNDLRWFENLGSGSFNSASTGTSLPAGDGIYFVIAVDADLDGDPDLVTASPGGAAPVELWTNGLLEEPAITSDPSGATILVGDDLDLTCAVSGSPAPTIAWYKDGADTGETGGTLSIVSAALSDDAVYTCVASNGVGSDATSAGATVTVQEAPSITSDPSGAALSEGDDLDLTCAASGTPAPTIAWYKDGADTGETGGTFSITSALPGDAGSYTCVASNGVGSDATSAAAVVTLACGSPPAAPTLVSRGVTGSDAFFVFESDPALTSLSWNFVGGAGCDNDGTDGTGGWVHDASGCVPTHTLTKPVTALLSTCGFVGPVDNGDSFSFDVTVEATAVNDTNAVFGDDQTRTSLTSFGLRLEYAKNVSVNGTAGVFGAVIDQSALTEQTFDSLTQEFGWNLATSVQYPYYLEPVSTAVSGGHTFDTLPVVASGGDCAGEGTDAAPAACRQDFALSANETDDCFVPAGTTVTVTFQILCRPQYAGSCDLPEGNTTTASFSVETDNFCPQVVEVASITPALTTYAGSAGGTLSTNYILETTLFGRVTADVEAGVQAKRTTLTGLDIVSSCTGCAEDTVQPFANLGTASTDYDFVWEDGGRVSSAAGEVQTDFSFTLNTNSLSFDNDATTGEAQITLTAYVSVEYDTPSAQGLERSYRVQAVTGPGSVSSSASAQAGVSSQAGTPSSTASSTVLGVSAGTAALAAVGLAVVAAIAVGAAVAARRRRTPLEPLKHTSSSVELNDTATVQV